MCAFGFNTSELHEIKTKFALKLMVGFVTFVVTTSSVRENEI